MRQLFWHLLSNALKYGRPGIPARVRISGRPTASGMVEVRVVDNGRGFDEKYLQEIFLPFRRLQGEGALEGAGMGLALCRRIVSRHGGRITAKSAPGKGATFVVTLPGRF